MSFVSTAPSFHQKQHVIVDCSKIPNSGTSFPYASHTIPIFQGILMGVVFLVGCPTIWGHWNFPDVTWGTRCLSEDAGVTTRMTLHFWDILN